MAYADESLYNVLLNGIIKDIDTAWRSRSSRATLILIYCGIDAMGYLTMEAGRRKVDRANFIDWANLYMKFRDVDQQPTLQLPGIELYAARCALLHTYSSKADLHDKDEGVRQIGYMDECLPEVAASDDVKHLVLVSIRGLVDAFSRGVCDTLQAIKADEERRNIFAERLFNMLHELPFK